MACGIYKIRNKINNKKYLGSSKVIESRCLDHRDRLREGKHINKHLQAAWNKYGEDSFEFSIVCICLVNELLKVEQSYLPKEKTYKALKEQGFYNDNPLTSGNSNKRSAETRAKMSQSTKGNKHSDETRAKISLSNKGKHIGKKLSEDTIAKMVESRKRNGVKCVATFKNRKHSDDTKSKMSKSQKGRKLSDETRSKIGDAQKGRKHTPEHIAKAAVGRKGRKLSDETKAKMRARWDKWRIKNRSKDDHIIV